jgi:transposase
MIPRFWGMDIHKNYVMAAAVDQAQQVTTPPTRVEMAQLAQWAQHHLNACDEVVLEAGTTAWTVADLLQVHVGRVVVANPYKTKLIAEAQIKNDKVDASVLARLLAARFICDVWIPDAPVREQRALAAHRATLQKQCTRIKNRLHNLLQCRNLRCPQSSLFSPAGQHWLHALQLPSLDRLQVRHLLAQLAVLQQELDETDRLIAQAASQDPRVPRLMQASGIGYYTAFAILAAIGQIQRFPSPDKLAAYAGLVPRQYQSGQHAFSGHITKTGSPLLRWLMVEAARVAVRWDPHWRQLYQRIATRRGSNIAAVAVARQLLVVIWYLLTRQTTYYHLQPQTFVTKLQEWAYRIGRAHLPANSSKEFVYQHLLALGLDDLAHSLSVRGRNGRVCIHTA